MLFLHALIAAGSVYIPSPNWESLSHSTNPLQLIERPYYATPVWFVMGIELPGAILKRANFERSRMMTAVFDMANLEGANLCDARPIGTRFSGANLSDAKLIRACCEGADLRGANLQGADVGFAVFRGADIRGANMDCLRIMDADFSGALYDEHTIFPNGISPDMIAGLKRA